MFNMESNKNNLLIIVGFFIIAILIVVSINKPHDMIAPPPTGVCKEDSLQSVINQLQIDLDNEEDGWDKKERRYEDIIFEYEFGIDRLKNYHPEAYKDFHRILGYREKYSHEAERENKKRLNISKW